MVAPAVVSASPASAVEASCDGLTQVGVRFVPGPDVNKNVGSIRVFQNNAKTGWCIESRRINAYANTSGTTYTSFQSTATRTLSPSPFRPTTRTATGSSNLYVYRVAAKTNAEGKPYRCLWFQLSVQKGTGTSYGAADAACFT